MHTRDLHPTDLQLARLAVRDDAAFEALVNRHAAGVHRLAAAMVGPGAADDVVQDVFIAVHRGLKGFRGEAAFSTWLHRITLNACHKALRGKGHPTVPLSDTPGLAAPHDPVHAGEQADLRVRLAQALHSLPADQREAVSLRELSGLDYAEIAEVTGAELGTVKSRINRGRAALRAYLTKMEITP
ncbi:sigma-70 family RNA polymerase sigma factor [Deinococcus sp. ZS9-10]|uniref:Sigma-70 family RNA polymerase sigma factor n=1 Tax=Deinococcus arenicola TaxID=2994950 RepID=A0ABU4DTW3_9DEIO|nr:sigma-70 family RNA polymerase sigma factor [Deinococcus sp. ZS9-10]